MVVDALEYEKPKTKQLAGAAHEARVLADKKVLRAHGGDDAHNVYLSGRNIPDVRVMRFADASAYEILWAGDGGRGDRARFGRGTAGRNRRRPTMPDLHRDHRRARS